MVRRENLRQLVTSWEFMKHYLYYPALAVANIESLLGVVHLNQGGIFFYLRMKYSQIFTNKIMPNIARAAE